MQALVPADNASHQAEQCCSKSSLDHGMEVVLDHLIMIVTIRTSATLPILATKRLAVWVYLFAFVSVFDQWWTEAKCMATNLFTYRNAFKSNKFHDYFGTQPTLRHKRWSHKFEFHNRFLRQHAFHITERSLAFSIDA
jgi:hypothetical protein